MKTRNTKSSITIAHIVYRLSIGGLENGIINLVNRLPRNRFRHIIISLTEIGDMADRIENPDVIVYELNKTDGIDFPVYIKLLKLLRETQPDILHTRNLGTLDCQIPGLFAGIKCRVHGEHGWGMRNIDGNRKKDRTIRRLISPIVHKYVAVSKDIESWLVSEVGIRRTKISQIYNGVDTSRFLPAEHYDSYCRRKYFVIGYVGRLQEEKNPLDLIRMLDILGEELVPQERERIRIMIVGDGPLYRDIEKISNESNFGKSIELLGSRNDIPEIMRKFDIFVLPSLNEGISNTILEAMATGLPVVANNVGGNKEIVIDNVTGFLVTPRDVKSMAESVIKYFRNPDLAEKHGAAALLRVHAEFSLDKMLYAYSDLYDSLIEG